MFTLIICTVDLCVLYIYTLGFTLTFLTQFIHCALCKILTKQGYTLTLYAHTP